MLGKIKKVNLRKVWEHEALNFTPWLAENLEEIGKVVGLELELQETEASVGPFSADILAKDTGNGKFVIIENQLEKTNHDHLGKCITYASVLDASAVIWIASKFTDEHKKALNWLNDHSADDIGFYGLELSLLQIDESKPAVNWNLISSPNEAVIQAVQRKDQGILTDTRKTQLKFWIDYKEKLIELGKVKSLQTPRPQYWFDVALGKSGVHLSNTFHVKNNEFSIRVYIHSNQTDEWLTYFESKKQFIETEIGSELSWNPHPDNRDKIIGLTKYFDLDLEDSWNNAIEWLSIETIKFKKVFSKLIKEK